MNWKKYWEMYLPVNLLGPGPSSYEKIIYRAAVWQRLTNTALMNLVEVSLCVTDCTECSLFSWRNVAAVSNFTLFCVSSSGCKQRLVAPSDVHSVKFTPPSVVWFSSGTLSNELARDITVSYWRGQLWPWRHGSTAHVDRINKCMTGCKARYFNPLCFELECVGYWTWTADCLLHRATAEFCSVNP